MAGLCGNCVGLLRLCLIRPQDRGQPRFVRRRFSSGRLDGQKRKAKVERRDLRGEAGRGLRERRVGLEALDAPILKMTCLLVVLWVVG
jgi:hypothetical protein